MNHFKEAAKTWDTAEKKDRNVLIAKSIVSKIELDQSYRLLDFGCGTGLLAEALGKLAKIEEILGIDPVKEMIQEFSIKFKSSPKAQGLSLNIEVENLPSHQGPFDLIVSAMAFHHLVDPLQTLTKLKTHLTNNGKIFVVDLDQEDGSFHADPQKMGVHHFGFSKKERDLWCERAGFRKVAHEIVFEITKNNKTYPVMMSVYSV